MRVVEVEAERTRDLWARVLRAGRRPEDLRFTGAVVPGSFWLAAEDDGEIVGIVSLIPRPDGVQLRSMAVDPAYQGRGVGRMLVEAAVDRLRAAGVPRVWCNARDTAIGFYERLGWTVTGPGFVDDELGIPHHRMQVTL